MTIWELSYSSGCIFGASELAWSSVSSIYSFDWLDVPGLSLTSTYSMSLPWRSNGSSWLEHFGEFYLSGENCVCSLGQALRPILTSEHENSEIFTLVGLNWNEPGFKFTCNSLSVSPSSKSDKMSLSGGESANFWLSATNCWPALIGRSWRWLRDLGFGCW